MGRINAQGLKQAAFGYSFCCVQAKQVGGDASHLSEWLNALFVNSEMIGPTVSSRME